MFFLIGIFTIFATKYVFIGNIQNSDFFLLLQVTQSLLSKEVIFTGYSQQKSLAFMFAHPPMFPIFFSPFYYISSYFTLNIISVFHHIIIIIDILIFTLLWRLTRKFINLFEIICANLLIIATMYVISSWPFVLSKDSEVIHYISLYVFFIFLFLTSRDSPVRSGIWLASALTTRTEGILLLPSILTWLLVTRSANYFIKFSSSFFILFFAIILPFILVDFNAFFRALFPTNIFGYLVICPPMLDYLCSVSGGALVTSSGNYVILSFLLICFFAFFIQNNLDIPEALAISSIIYFTFIPVTHSRYFVPSFYLVMYCLISHRTYFVSILSLVMLKFFGFSLQINIFYLIMLTSVSKIQFWRYDLYSKTFFEKKVPLGAKSVVFFSLLVGIFSYFFILKSGMFSSVNQIYFDKYINLYTLKILEEKIQYSQYEALIITIISYNIPSLFVYTIIIFIYSFFIFILVMMYNARRLTIITYLFLGVVLFKNISLATFPDFVGMFDNIVERNFIVIEPKSLICSPYKSFLWRYKLIKEYTLPYIVARDGNCFINSISSATVNSLVFLDEPPDREISNYYVVLSAAGIWRVMGIQPKLLDNIVARTPDGKVYLIFDHKKTWVQSEDDFASLGLSWEQVRLVGDNDLDDIYNK